jgi:hypothetical protein
MKTPTLGYEGDTAISKLEMARVQLEEAITLFVGEKFLCALTLAGASEEILSRMLNARGEPSAMERSAEAVLNIKRMTGISGLAEVTDKQLFKGWNAARNAAKHHNADESETVVLNLFDEAYWMVRRALANAKGLGLNVGNELDFENWVTTNINM